MTRTSFVFHFEYIEGIPEEYAPAFAMYIINYAKNGVEPEFSTWAEQAIWEKIKRRIDYDNELFNKKLNNLKNRKKTSDESITSRNESITSRVDTGSEYENVNVSEYETEIENDDVYVNESEEPSSTPSHCTTSLSQNIKNTTLLYGFTLTPKQIESFLGKIGSFSGDVPSLVNFVLKKTKAQYEGKPEAEMRKLMINALTKYPESHLEEFDTSMKYSRQKAEKDSLRLKYFNPPSTKCTCGHDMQERSDTDEKTGIDYMAYKCPSCSTMLTCEDGKWAYSQGAPDFSMVAV